MKNLFDIKDKVIVLTGGCGILGRNIANYLAEQGAKIVVLDRVEEAGRELEAELNQKSEALFLVTDVLNKEVLEENKKAILERFGTIDVLLNARRQYAGRYHRSGQDHARPGCGRIPQSRRPEPLRYGTPHHGVRRRHGKEQEGRHR